MTKEEKMKIVINNYFKTECSVNTSIREAFEKGFRIGASKVQEKHGEWIERECSTEDKQEGWPTVIVCSQCDFPATTFYSEDCEHRTQIRTRFCPNCGAKMNQSDKTCDCYSDGRCVGTKEIDPCSCGGNKSKCDFYENVRREGDAE